MSYNTNYNNDMDAFLGEAMKRIKNMSQEQLEELKRDFKRVMQRTYEFFGDKNFRLSTTSSRGRVNIALLESVSYFFANKSDSFLREHKEAILSNYANLLKNRDFIDAIQFATGDTKRVKNRFDFVQQILGEVSC